MCVKEDGWNFYQITTYIHYHPGKANRVADALSRKSAGTLMAIQGLPRELQKEIQNFDLQMIIGRMATLQIQPILLDQIREAQLQDEDLIKIRQELQEEKQEEFSLSKDGTMLFKGRICVPNQEELKTQLLKEAHQAPYSMHPGTTKMYQNLKQRY